MRSPRFHHLTVAATATRPKAAASSTDRVFSADPKAAREDRVGETARVVRDAMTAEAASFDVVAAFIGLSPTDLKRCVSPTSGRVLALADAAALPPAVLRRVVAWLADSLGCAVVELPTGHADIDLAMLARTTRETADVVATALDAAADGHLSRVEGSQLEKECDEALGELLAIREIARLAQREGVVGFPRGTRGAA